MAVVFGGLSDEIGKGVVVGFKVGLRGESSTGWKGVLVVSFVFVGGILERFEESIDLLTWIG